MTRVGRAHRTIVSGVVFCAAVAALAGCTSASPSSSSAPPAPATTTAAPSSAPPATTPVASSPAAVSPSTAAPSPTSAGPSPTASSSPLAVGIPGCSTSGLKVVPGLAQAAAGSVYQVIDFTNISGGTCTIFGYPGVALAGGTPVTQVGAAASRSTATPAALVTLAPGATGNALLRIVQALNYPPSKCHPVTTTYLQIYPPDQTTPVYLAYKTTGCSLSSVLLLSVGVVQLGNGG